MKGQKLLISIALISSILAPAFALAETSPSQSPDLGADLPQISNPLNNPKLQVSIPGFSGFRNITCDQPTTSPDDQSKRQALYCVVPWLADYINGLYRYGIGIIVILAVIVMMIAGVMWLTAAGNEAKIADAKQWLTGGILGIFIAAGSYLFLNVINPVLTQLSPIKLAYVEKEDLPDLQEYITLQQEIQNGGLTTNDHLKPATGNIVTIQVETLTGTRQIQVDKSIEEAVKKSFLEMKNAGFSVKEISHWRPESTHCHKPGLAIDINATYNYCIDCYGKTGAKVGNHYRPLDGPGANSDYTGDNLSMQKKIVQIWMNNGFCWGGNWKSFKDYMHFSTPSCRNGAECGLKGQYDFGESVKKNHQDLGISYP